VTIEHDLYKNIRDINACIDFKMIKVKVLIIFTYIVGFPLRKEGRYNILYKFKLTMFYLTTIIKFNYVCSIKCYACSVKSGFLKLSISKCIVTC
jgi:hypothetical protein